MSNFILIPVQLDALVLAKDHFVAGPMADFSQLPYTNGSQDIHAETPNLSEEFLATPFQDQSLYLKAGIHLHWSLPDALTNAQQTIQGSQFPAVPNRWFVLRSKNGKAEKQWIVESDYLYPENEDELIASVTIPYRPDRTKGQTQPYRYLGRAIPLTNNALPNADPQAEYLQPLTAVGYGEPTFAAFYPNCYSVFGLHDGDYTGSGLNTLQYDLIGWYSDPTQDFLQTFLTNFTHTYQLQYGTLPDNTEILSALENSAQWTFTQDSKQPFPDAVLCYGRVTFTLDQAPGLTSQNEDLTIAVGATGTEALSAYLARKIDSSRAAIIEDQLEALYIMPQLEKGQLDIGPAFSAARHARAFTASAGGSIWNIQTDNTTNGSQDANAQPVPLPENMTHLLNKLNLSQQAFDHSSQEIEAQRVQLFADWYKYMLCVYRPEDSRDAFPDIDEVRFSIEHMDIIPLQQQLAEVGTLELQFDGNGSLAGAQAPGQAITQGAHLAQAITELLQVIASFNQANAAQGITITYVLKQLPGPRYWQPNEPAVLVVGKSVEATTRHGQDGRLRADGLLEALLLTGNTTIPNLISTQFSALRTLMDGLSKSGIEQIGINTWTQQPWNPIMLEWETEVFPLNDQGNLDPSRGGYTSDFITGNAQLYNGDAYFNTLKGQLDDPATTSPLAVEQTDLALQDGQGAITRGANIYNGYSILAPHASTLLQNQLESYLQKNLLPLYYDGLKIPVEQQTASYFDDHHIDIIKWYLSTYAFNANDDALYTLAQAYNTLLDEDFHCLSQSLGGFNSALLMRKQTFQLPIADPLGFDDYQAFTQKVNDLVMNSNRSAPQPLNDFNPIRNGTMRLQRLRLLDTFGQSGDLDRAEVITTQQMTTDGNPYLITLPLRLMQPARLNFRWLSAASDDQELNDHPASSPVCGWILPNDLDSSLMIYDGSGSALGQIDQQVMWLPAPGSQQSITPENIANAALKNLVTYILSQGKDFFDNFFSVISTALEQIEPETFAQHQDLAILMGRPIALVRASLNLELQGLPALHQGWETFLAEMQQTTRDDDNFTGVQFPLRIGEHQQLNDGVLGFWSEAADKSLTGQAFHSAYSEGISDGHISSSITLFQALEDQPMTLSMLVDPRGTVHATSGIVPIKEISIPPDQFAAALQAIEITFLTAPILTGQGTIQLPLPAEAGYTWSWLQKEQSTWSRIPSVPVIQQQSFQATFNGLLWNTLLDTTIGWLTSTPDDPLTANIVESASRASNTLNNGFAGIQDIVEKILASKNTITQADLFQQISTLIATPIWQALLTTGTHWLSVTPTDPTWALVIPKSTRASTTLQGILTGLEQTINQIFDLCQRQITSPNMNATFTGQQELIDGWLLLSST
jgi:hypothetical protein